MTHDIRSSAPRKAWPDYRAVWRWHFYAGLLCIPFVLWLSVTGAIYLFKPQVEGWLEAPYERLATDVAAKAPSAQVDAALAKIPNGHFVAYELPRTTHSASRVLIGEGEKLYRAYVNPRSLAVLKIVDEDQRFMNFISFLHGELAIGDRGSIIVEIAACWAIVMLGTGVYLWWPRTLRGLGGVLFPRLWGRERMVWRDLHAVTGVWVCALALGLLLTGLPWAKTWGGYLREVREITGTSEGVQDWSNGRDAEIAARTATSHAEHDHEMGDMPMDMMLDYSALDRLAPVVARLQLPAPALILPPAPGRVVWTAKSNAQNRTRRMAFEFDPETAAIVGRRGFADQHPIDQAISVGVAAHEGQLFGWLNQLLGLVAALGLILLCISAVMMWLKRRPHDALGAPAPMAPPRFAPMLGVGVVALAVLFPLFGASLVAVIGVEWLALRRIAPVRRWLGLSAR